MDFVDFVWKRFGAYYELHDTHKDEENKGLFQRYLSVFGLELNEEIVPAIENFLINVDPEQAADKYLAYISYSLGKPDDILGDTEKYRELLTQIISIYQIKGTFRSYKALFALFGLNVSITEKFPPDNIYDVDLLYDEQVFYDDDACSKTCVHYALTYTNMPGFNLGPLTEELQIKLRNLITSLIEPHSAELDELTYEEPVQGPISMDIINIVDSGISIEFYGDETLLTTLGPGTSQSLYNVFDDVYGEYDTFTFKQTLPLQSVSRIIGISVAVIGAEVVFSVTREQLIEIYSPNLTITFNSAPEPL